MHLLSCSKPTFSTVWKTSFVEESQICSIVVFILTSTVTKHSELDFPLLQNLNLSLSYYQSCPTHICIDLARFDCTSLKVLFTAIPRSFPLNPWLFLDYPLLQICRRYKESQKGSSLLNIFKNLWLSPNSQLGLCTSTWRILQYRWPMHA